MLRARTARKRNQKISKLETTKVNSERTLAALDAELQALNNNILQPASAPTPPQARAYAPTLPQPPTWKSESKDANSTAELIYSITDAELKQSVQIFDNKEVNIYDANDVEIRTTRGTVLKG